MIVEAQGISVAIGGRPILNSETLSCRPGSMTALIGPSGSGKTTLLHCLGLLLPVDRGRIVIDGDDVTRYSAAAQRRFWRDHAAFVLQDYGLMDEESVAFNVTMRTGFLGRRMGTRDQQRMEQALERTGLAGRPDEPAGQLSGGEKQRLALARAIYKQAKILFVDEPTASLDGANRKMVIDLFAGFAESGCTVIVATHDTEMIDACAWQHEVTSGHPPRRHADL